MTGRESEFGLAIEASGLVKVFGKTRAVDGFTPDLLFLDEPTTGLDPHSRYRVWDVVRALVTEGTTVLTTQ